MPTTETEFFRFPHTPHIVWLAEGQPRDDKLLASSEVDDLLDSRVVVEEKVDGANIGISFNSSGALQLQNRGEFIRDGAHPQFEPVWGWVYERIGELRDLLGDSHILFGEWCYAVHSIEYDALPDWFVAFDIYSLRKEKFYSVERRNELLEPLDIEIVPELERGHFELDELLDLLERESTYSEGPMEGIVVRELADGRWSGLRGKIVRAEFLQELDEHWSMQELQTNSVAE